MPLTRLERQVKLINKFGNTLNTQERKRFEISHLREFLYTPALIAAFSSVEIVDGEEVTHNRLGANPKVNKAISSVLFIALERLSKTEFKQEIQGAILCYDPVLMPSSETTIAYTSWGLAFRFDQENLLSQDAAKYFIDLGFTLSNDKDNKQHFVADIEKILKS